MSDVANELDGFMVLLDISIYKHFICSYVIKYHYVSTRNVIPSIFFTLLGLPYHDM